MVRKCFFVLFQIVYGRYCGESEKFIMLIAGTFRCTGRQFNSLQNYFQVIEMFDSGLESSGTIGPSTSTKYLEILKTLNFKPSDQLNKNYVKMMKILLLNDFFCKIVHCSFTWDQ